MKHYFRTVLYYPDGEVDRLDEYFETKQEAIYAGEYEIECFIAGGETLKLAGEDYSEGEVKLEVEECLENDDGEIVKIEREQF